MALRSSRRTFALASVMVSLLVTVLFLEVALRFLPVSDGLRGMPVNDDNPVYRFAPNRTLRWSKGWNFSLVNELRTNNYGFISDIDYDPTATSPLLAVIGDSFVEAAMVPYSQTVAGLLNKSMEGHGRVYAFGASGAALSQYLAYARYVRDEFRPTGLVITIAGNDFDESLIKYRSYPGFHYFVEKEDGTLHLQRVDRSLPSWKDLVVTSTVGLYVVMNLEAGNVVDRLKQRAVNVFGKGRQYVGNTDATTERGRISDSKKAVEAFLSTLPAMSGLAPNKIALVLDAPRPELYVPARLREVEQSFFSIMRRYLAAGAQVKGFEVIDLEATFALDYQQRGLKFEYSNDYHWNPIGHEVVATAIQQSPIFDVIFGGGRATCID